MKRTIKDEGSSISTGNHNASFANGFGIGCNGIEMANKELNLERIVKIEVVDDWNVDEERDGGASCTPLSKMNVCQMVNKMDETSLTGSDNCLVNNISIKIEDEVHINEGDDADIKREAADSSTRNAIKAEDEVSCIVVGFNREEEEEEDGYDSICEKKIISCLEINLPDICDSRASKTFSKNVIQCKDCGKCFTQRSRLKQHAVMHSTDRAFSCETCGKRFHRKGCLKRHLLIHSEIKLFNCEHCPKSFSHKEYLRQHLFVHSQAKALACDVCDRRFSRKDYLDKHLTVHSNVKAFSCNICGKCFPCNSNLKRHLFVHSNKKAFTCDICGKCFSYKTNLKAHSVVHSNVKAFECDVCGKCFSCRSTLKQHLVVHSNVKPFACNVCGKRYNRNTKLKKHLIVHSEKLS